MSQGKNGTGGLSFTPQLEEVYQRCLDGSHDAILLTNGAGIILYVNSAWQRLYGFSTQEAIGNTPRLLRSGKHSREFYETMWSQILDPTKANWKGELTNRAKDGRLVSVFLTITPILGSDGAVQGYMSSASDIGEKQKLDAQILRQDRLASIGLLATGLAHEIGTPLGVIRGRAELLLKDAQKESAQSKSLDIIVKQIDRISTVIYALLNLAKTDPSSISVKVSLATVIEEIKKLIEQRLIDLKIQFEMDFGKEVKVFADSCGMDQVFLNLLMNCVHAVETAMEQGRGGPHFIKITAEDKVGKWQIRVTDSGCGVSQENMNHIFKPFFTTKQVGQGTGLGLPISHQIITALGGTLWVESVVGQGTSFIIELPRA